MSDIKPKSFAEVGADERRGLLGEFYEYFKDSRKFWLIPLLVVLFGMGIVIVLGSTAAAPFIYTLF